MTTIVVGGPSRKVGKTSVVEAVIASWPQYSWTAVKMSSHWHEDETALCEEDREEICRIDEDHACGSTTDTGRFLSAGASRSFWVRIQKGRLHEALPTLMPVLHSNPYVIIESNGIVDHIQPDLYLMVIRYDIEDCKESVRKTIGRAHAIVAVNYSRTSPAWMKDFPDVIEGIPIFPLTDPPKLPRELKDFISLRL
jgi:Ni2+-binding GTPase involved in maturation of urease and hydrogenase